MHHSKLSPVHYLSPRDDNAQTALIAELRASEQRLEAVINSALDAIICVDQNQRITVFNPTAAMLFQCPARDALGSGLERFLPNAQQVLAFAQIATQAGLGEMTALTASGKSLAIEISVSFEHHAEGATTTVFARDLTASKRAEARRSELEAQLRESHKMHALGTMAGGIAHDFNNILHAILGNVELAKVRCTAHGSTAADNTEGSLLESLLEIEKAARRARDLVRQILTYSRNQPPLRNAISLVDVAHEVQRLLHVTLPPHVCLSLHLPPTLPPVLADTTQSTQALLNLCTNAIHAAAQQHGQVRVSAAPVQPDARLRQRLGLAEGNYVALTVEDEGPGMDNTTLPHIFEPFFTTKAVGEGTGLGLPVVHGVMRSHGGGIDVESSPGHGSRFTLYFPAAAAGTPAPPCPAATPIAPSVSTVSMCKPDTNARQHHVMYVDDDHALVLLVQRMLGQRGYSVSGFTDPDEAIRALHADPARYDLLITDHNMPGHYGTDLVRAARGIRPDLPVALVSGDISTEIEQAALAAGACALLHKPDDVQELCATVDRLIHKHDNSADFA